MQVSAEMRWLGEGDCPDEVAGWFSGSSWVSDPDRVQRRDEYFVQPGNVEIGCKLRDVDVPGQTSTELKAMITRFERNRIELWGKWDWHVPANARSLLVHKDRQLRLCSASSSGSGSYGEVPLDGTGHPRNLDAMPDDTCQIELTRIRVEGFDARWWTLGLEAWGDLPSAPLVLARCLDILDPPVRGARLCNYPQFLDDLISSRDATNRIENDLIV